MFMYVYKSVENRVDLIIAQLGLGLAMWRLFSRSSWIKGQNSMARLQSYCDARHAGDF